VNISGEQDEIQVFEEALAAKPENAQYWLRLFVSGSTPRSARAIQNIQALCEENLHGRYDLEVIDIYQHPEHLKPEQVVVIPTLVKKLPLPLRRIVGDLSDKERVLIGLDIVKRDEQHRDPTPEDDSV
jgi:circadian clock protein KaiB